MIAVRPREYSVIFDAIPGTVGSLLWNPGFSPVSIDHQTRFCSDTIFIRDINIVIDNNFRKGD